MNIELSWCFSRYIVFSPLIDAIHYSFCFVSLSPLKDTLDAKEKRRLEAMRQREIERTKVSLKATVGK